MTCCEQIILKTTASPDAPSRSGVERGQGEDSGKPFATPRTLQDAQTTEDTPTVAEAENEENSAMPRTSPTSPKQPLLGPLMPDSLAREIATTDTSEGPRERSSIATQPAESDALSSISFLTDTLLRGSPGRRTAQANKVFQPQAADADQSDQLIEPELLEQPASDGRASLHSKNPEGHPSTTKDPGGTLRHATDETKQQAVKASPRIRHGAARRRTSSRQPSDLGLLILFGCEE